MSKISQYCFYILALFLPIQTIFATFTSVRLGLPVWVNLWKELIVLIICSEFITKIILHVFNLKKFVFLSSKNSALGFNNQFSLSKKTDFTKLIPLILISLATIIIIFNSLVFGEFHSSVFIIGFRFELFWLWFFAVVATWFNLFYNPEDTKFKNFKIRMEKFIFAGFGLVVLFVLTQYSFGQEKVNNLVGFGYAESATYLVNPPSCHAIDFGQEQCRLSGTFSTPNHLAGYLLLILPIFILKLVQKFDFTKDFNLKKFAINRGTLIYSFACLLILLFIFLTSSRYALLAVGMWFLLSIGFFLPKNGFRKLVFGFTLLIPLIITLFPIYIGFKNQNPNFEINTPFLPVLLSKPSSTVEHYRHTLASLTIFTKDPKIIFTGLGLGNSGPAAKFEYQDLASDNLLFKRFNSVTLDWYILPHRITIPENWYIQLALNGGVFYAVIYIFLLLYPVRKIIAGMFSKQQGLSFYQLQLGMGFLAILTGNLFLHLWENQTITIYWTLLWIMSFIYTYPTNIFNNKHT